MVNPEAESMQRGGRSEYEPKTVCEGPFSPGP